MLKHIKKTFNGYKPGGPGFDQKITGSTHNGMKLIFYPGRHGLTRWTRFWSKMTVLTRNGPKLIFYPGRHGLNRIDSVNSVSVKNDGFDPKRPETHFYPGRHGLTRIDLVDSVLTERCGWLEKNIFLNFPFS
jgi:hypothetical protein